MRTARPLVSVIVPAYNAEATIAETLASALAQSWREIEVLVVDDGSTDRTAEIVAGFMQTDDRVKLERGAHRGACAARNRAIAASRGEFIAPLDADDLWHPAKLERQMAAMLAAPERPGFVYSLFRLIDGDGRVIGLGAPYACRGPVLNRLVYKFFIGNGSASLFTRAAIVEAGAYEETLRDSDDYLLHLRIARRHPAELASDYLVGYRIRPGSLSSDQEKVFEGWRQASAKFREECGDVPARIWAWASAKQCFNLGLCRLRRKRWRSGGALLAQALWLDPERTLVCLCWLLTRRLTRRPRSAPARPALSFSAMSEVEAAPALAGIERFDWNRLERLAGLDEPRPFQSFRD